MGCSKTIMKDRGGIKVTFKELLEKKDIHGAQLARRVGCDRSLVSCWVTGKTRPSLDMLPKIAKVLGVTIEEVLGCFTEINL